MNTTDKTLITEDWIKRVLDRYSAPDIKKELQARIKRANRWHKLKFKDHRAKLIQKVKAAAIQMKYEEIVSVKQEAIAYKRAIKNSYITGKRKIDLEQLEQRFKKVDRRINIDHICAVFIN